MCMEVLTREKKSVPAPHKSVVGTSGRSSGMHRGPSFDESLGEIDANLSHLEKVFTCVVQEVSGVV